MQSSIINFKTAITQTGKNRMLPITEWKDDIINAVRNYSFTIISAETGSGKSTQVPQYLADYYSQVVVTEPRVMAAKTLARRVSEEMGVEVGQEVGYKTAYDKNFSFQSKILYATDGLQLIRTIFSEDTTAENVLIIDEAHEWNLNIETLVAWCKFMQGKWNTKVVIMSATLDAIELANFFGKDTAVVNVSGNLYDVTVEERSEYAFIDTIKENISNRKNVLVFVEGKKEIKDVIEQLEGQDATVLPLHGELDWDEQKKCFKNYSNPKVIVATNVAQTSITIPDIDVVVDNGNVKMTVAENGIQGLFIKEISQSDIMQRKGRAGRTKNGKYFLCSNTGIKERAEYSTPEIQRSILDRVVLQLAEIGLDAEELKFYHQPDIKAILEAKRELNAIGALSGNEVTLLGHKIVKIPVSVQFARMIVEAEKYGVTEQVMTISAIIEMGGLLAKGSGYYEFTAERGSDLLAELDVWNSLNQKEYINFKALGINKKNFFKIKDHIKKIRETLYGSVEMTHNDDREAIVKSCLCGLVSHIYARNYDSYYGIEGTAMRLDRNSCVSNYSSIIVGIPKTIEFENQYGFLDSLNLVKFATEVNVNTLLELAPDAIEEVTSLRYSSSMDAVEITVIRKFMGIEVGDEISYDKTHPAYNGLKAKYEEEQRRYESYKMSARATSSDTRQRVIVIDGKQFEVSYHFWENEPHVYLDDETLFTTEVKQVFLDSGARVYFRSERLWDRKEMSIPALRNAVEMHLIIGIREDTKRRYDGVKISNIYDALQNAEKIGEIMLAMNNGGYGDMPILAYGYLSLKKNAVTLKLGNDEEVAKSNTLEALQYLFLKEIEKKYGENKFSHQGGKKKKVLTDSEKEEKKDFDSLVRELAHDLTFENVTDNLEFLEDYYQDLMK